MASETHILRIPAESHKGRNGFITSSFTDPAQITLPHDKELAIEAHRRAMFVLENKKREVPRCVPHLTSNDNMLILAALKR